MESIGVSVMAITLLLLANGFFVAAEFALVKAKVSRLEAEADAGGSAAQLTVRIQRRIEPYLAACQLGITMASLGLGWIGEPAVAALLEPVLRSWSLSENAIHQIAFLVGFLVFSSLHIVIGEQVPKSFAIRQAETVSQLCAHPLRFFYVLAFPLTWALDRASSGVLRLFGVAEGTHADIFTLTEIKSLVTTSTEHGEISTERADMLHNLIEMDERPIGWVMVPRHRVTVLTIAGDPGETLEVLKNSPYSRFPVLEGGGSEEIVGTILTKDLYKAALNGLEPWKDLTPYCREPIVVLDRQPVARTFETLRTAREHMAIVADEYGQIVGIVTLEDLLEEIVGEIVDETDRQERNYFIKQLAEGRWIVEGTIPLSDAQREFGMSAETSLGANTLSGLILERAQEIVGPGESIVEGGFRLTVRNVEDRQISRVLVQRLDEEDE